MKHKRFGCACEHARHAHFKREFESVCATCEQIDTMKASFVQSDALLRALGENNAAAKAVLRSHAALVAWLDAPEGTSEQTAALTRAQAAQKEAQELIVLLGLPEKPHS